MALESLNIEAPNLLEFNANNITFEAELATLVVDGEVDLIGVDDTGIAYPPVAPCTVKTPPVGVPAVPP